MIWYDIKYRKPLATEIGDWDGKKSDKILVCTLSRRYYIAVMYHTIMDGSEDFDFYDDNDFPIKNVKYWAEIDEAPYNS
jgi:hypothetical protein